MQYMQELEARALRRADRVDDLDRRIRAIRSRQRGGPGSVDRGRSLLQRISGWFRRDRSAADLAKLETERRRAVAERKIAVDELLQAHCERLRAAPENRHLLAPAEAVLRTANEDYHPWDRALMFGGQALRALNVAYGRGSWNAYDTLIAFSLLAPLLTGGRVFRMSSSSTLEDLDRVHAAGQALEVFVKSLKLLARDHPDVSVPNASAALEKCAQDMLAARTRIGIMKVQGAMSRSIREIGAILSEIQKRSAGERGDVAAARMGFDGVNNRLVAAAWTKIPARLRPY